MLRRKGKTDHTSIDTAVPATAQLYELIAIRAYELYQMREAQAGDELADWLTAEREILSGMSGLKSEAIDSIGQDAAPAPESPKKSSKLMSMGSSRKKAGTSPPRSPAKPKSVHP